MESRGFKILEYLYENGGFPDTTPVNIIGLLRGFYNEMYNGTDSELIINAKIRDYILRPLVDDKYADFSSWRDIGVGKRGTNPDYVVTVNKIPVVNGVLLKNGYDYVMSNRDKFKDELKEPIPRILEKCPFTDTTINAHAENNIYEYDLNYNSYNYKMRLAFVDWGKVKELDEANKWIYRGMLFNNEWPVEPDTLITPQLISHIYRRGDFPRDFNGKLDYFLLKSYLAGGAEFRWIKFDLSQYYDGYADSAGEFGRIMEGLQKKGFISIEGNGSSFMFEEAGRVHAEELDKKNNLNVPKRFAGNTHPRALILSTKQDEKHALLVSDMVGKLGFSTSNFGYFTGEPNESTFNVEKAIENLEQDYIIFIKSQNSEKNDSIKRLQVIVEREYRPKYRGYKSVFFLAMEDGPYNSLTSPSSILYDTLYDFRIASSRKYILKEMLADWNLRIQNQTQDALSVIETLKKGRIFDFPTLPLSGHDKEWLQIVYERFLENKETYYNNYLPQYWDRFPNYDPTKINEALLDNGSYITFLGIWHIHHDEPILTDIERCIFSLNRVLKAKGNFGDFSSGDLVNDSGVELHQVLRSLILLSRFGGFIQIRQTSDSEIKFGISGESGLQKIRNFISLENEVKIKYPDLFQTENDKETEANNEPKLNLNEEINEKGEHAYRTPVIIKDRELEHVMGVKELAKDVKEIIDDLPDEQDQMIGVFGRWGRGKTVFLSELKDALGQSNKNKYTIVEYRAWKYQETPASWAYLYETLTEKYQEKPENFSLSKYFNYWKRIFKLNLRRNGLLPIIKFFLSILFILLIAKGLILWNNVSALIGIPIAVTTLFAFLRKTFKEYKHSANDLINKYALKHHYKDSMGLQAEIQKEIVTLLKAWSPYLSDKKRKGKIVLIVEDIDRCSEDRIVQNIDSLRVMLEDKEILSKFIVITAIDDSILKNAIKEKCRKLGIKQGLRKHIGEHLDKVFLLAIKLGSLSKKETEEFIDVLLKNESSKTSSNEQKASQPVKGYSKTPLPSTRELGPDFLPNEDEGHVENKIQTDYNECKELVPSEVQIIKEIMLKWEDATPRKMRIFYYRYLLCKMLLYKRYASQNSMNVWQSPEGVRHILDIMLTYINSNDSTLISIDKDNIEALNDNQVDLPRIASKYTVNTVDCINLLEVLEMVIAY